MSDEVLGDWIWQGFYGPKATVLAAKLETEQLPSSVVGVIIPPIGQGTVDVDPDGSEAMYAVQTRTSAPLPVPDGLRAARPEIVGRLVGA
jgi:hypothetical protein